MRIVRQLVCQHAAFRLAKKIMEALVDKQPRADLGAAFHSFLYQPFRREQTSRIVGIAQHNQIDVQCDGVPIRLCDR